MGGEGTRLRPLTYTTPKQLLPVAEMPMIERVLAHLEEHGVSDAVLSLGYRPDAFRAAYPDGKAGGVRLEYVVEHEPLDTAGAIRFAATEAGISETFLVLNGDVLTDLDIGALLELHGKWGAEATLHLTPVEDPSAFGVVETDPKGRVTAFIEKPPREQATTNLINAGTYVMEPSVLGRIPAGRRVSVERETFPALVADKSLFALATDDYWLDTGTPDKYLQANRDLLEGRRPWAPHPRAEQVAPGEWRLGSSVVDGEVHCSLVGEGARVERGSSVRSAVVGGEAVVEAGATVAGSVVLAGALVKRGAVVEDSVLGHRSVVREKAELRAATVVGDRATVEAGARLRASRVPGEPGQGG